MYRIKKFRSPILSKLCYLGAMICIGTAYFRYDQHQLAKKEINYRKNQLAKPVLHFSQNDIINPPWNQANFQQYLYRKVQFSAAPNYAKTILFTRVVNGVQGYQYFIPYFVKEENNKISKKGILVDKGFIPKSDVQNLKTNQKKKDQNVIGYFTQSKELKDGFSIFSQKEYSCIQAENSFQPQYLRKIVRQSGLENTQTASMIVTEFLPETRILDWNDPQKHINQQSSIQSSALKLRKTPDQLSQEAKRYSLGFILLGCLGGVLS